METFETGRMELAQKLLNAGQKPVTTARSIEDSRRTVWGFALNERSAQIIADYFRAHGKPVPHQINLYQRGAYNA